MRMRMELMRPCVNVNAVGQVLGSARAHVQFQGESLFYSSSSGKGSSSRRLFQSRALPQLASSFPPMNTSTPSIKRERCVKASAAGSANPTSKEEDVVFVAGSTGKVGSRLVRELLKLGFRVRAGVRSSQRAGTLLQSVRQMKPVDSAQSPPAERLELVECDLENQSIIRPAIGNALIVICCIGASEKEVLDITGPYRIDYKATVNLIQAATLAKVDHFILLTSLGTNKIGFPAAILNLFWGVLLWKRKAEEALISSGLPYTIVRPGGMERPTDAFKETHNLVLANEDTYFGGLVSNLQVAELMACMARNRRLSYCKVVEVIAETTAPLLPMEQLLSTIPSQRPLPPQPKEEPEPAAPPPVVSESDKPQEEDPLSKSRTQSPYAAYENLKPPTSPTPTKPDTQPAKPNSSSVDLKESAQVADGGARSLSPYPSYDDWKPPSSPSPNAPNNGTPISISLSESQSSDPTASEKEQGDAQHKPYPLSPYTMYEDLKPPSSPSPSAPNYGAPISISSSTNQNSGPSASVAQPKSYPLSPYTMYEDLKPPTSPLPSVPK